jgi:bifunctional UDP-N-acetylglucosamine pyrophosphorylase/glucosamine-1-phosphate N-acetyltransferase
MPAPTVVILAAGEGTRMRSALPKVLHPICGRPMILWPLLAARDAGAERVIVVDNPKRLLADHLPDGVEVAIQSEPRGTGDAVAAAANMIDPAAPVLVINGDMPLITAEAIVAVVAAHEEAEAAATLASMELEDPSGYGRVIRAADGAVERIAESKSAGDATDEELSIREVNAGLYVFDGGALLAALSSLSEDNAQGERYLPDVVPVLLAAGKTVQAHPLPDPDLALGVNDRVDLAQVTRLAQQRIHAAHQRAGVTIVDPASTLIDATVAIGEDTTIEPATFLRGKTRIGARCTSVRPAR